MNNGYWHEYNVGVYVHAESECCLIATKYIKTDLTDEERVSNKYYNYKEVKTEVLIAKVVLIENSNNQLAALALDESGNTVLSKTFSYSVKNRLLGRLLPAMTEEQFVTYCRQELGLRD